MISEITKTIVLSRQGKQQTSHDMIGTCSMTSAGVSVCTLTECTTFRTVWFSNGYATFALDLEYQSEKVDAA